MGWLCWAAGYGRGGGGTARRGGPDPAFAAALFPAGAAGVQPVGLAGGGAVAVKRGQAFGRSPEACAGDADPGRYVGGGAPAQCSGRVPGEGQPEGADQGRVLLVDDVMTTGATAAACALTVKRAGAACVDVLTLARVAGPRTAII